MSVKLRYLVLTLPLLLGCDVWTKSTARSLELGQRVDVVEGWLAWTHAENPFIAFSVPIPMGVVLAVGVALVGWLSFEAWRLPASSRWRSAGLAAMLAGAVGNLVDRVQDGTVTDMLMLHTEHPALAPWLRERFGTAVWPIFNVADVALLVGVVLWMLGTGLEADEGAEGDDPALDPA